MANQRGTFAKRQRETDLKDKARAKEARRAAKKAEQSTTKGPQIAWDEAGGVEGAQREAAPVPVRPPAPRPAAPVAARPGAPAARPGSPGAPTGVTTGDETLDEAAHGGDKPTPAPTTATKPTPTATKPTR